MKRVSPGQIVPGSTCNFAVQGSNCCFRQHTVVRVCSVVHEGGLGLNYEGLSQPGSQMLVTGHNAIAKAVTTGPNSNSCY
jgi:hypothetical protein